MCTVVSSKCFKSGGEGGIRTLDTGVSPYNGLANRRLQPLGHLSATGFYLSSTAAAFALQMIASSDPQRRHGDRLIDDYVRRRETTGAKADKARGRRTQATAAKAR